MGLWFAICSGGSMSFCLSQLTGTVTSGILPVDLWPVLTAKTTCLASLFDNRKGWVLFCRVLKLWNGYGTQQFVKVTGNAERSNLSVSWFLALLLSKSERML